jgi:REP-associated tyrosine transposase
MRAVEPQSRHDRKRLRLSQFDYSAPGYYFITLCVWRRRCILGNVDENCVILSDLGRLVSDALQRVPERYVGILLDAFVVMPNHLHALLELTGSETALSAAIGAFKSLSTNAARTASMIADAKLWQRGFHDHVVRSDADLDRLREYIANNPLKWHLDRENPANIRP